MPVVSAGRALQLYVLARALRGWSGPLSLRTEDRPATVEAVRSGRAHLGLTSLLEADPELDGTRVVAEAMLVAVGNGPAYGGGMRVTPEASFDDGLLDVLILHKISTPEFLRVFPKVFTGAHVHHPAVQILRAHEVRLRATGIVSYADGERFAPLPMSIDVVPGALTVLA